MQTFLDKYSLAEAKLERTGQGGCGGGGGGGDGTGRVWGGGPGRGGTESCPYFRKLSHKSKNIGNG